MDRRSFLKTAAGLFIPAAPALILPKLVRAQGGMGPGPGMVHSTGGGGLGLQTNCTGFWEMETTGWTDATGNGTTLTGTGAPTTTTGKVGNAASLVASTSYLQAASNTNIAFAGGDFSVSFWLNTAGTPGTDLYVSKSANSFGNRDWGFSSFFNGSANVFRFTVYDTGSNLFSADDTVGATIGSFVHLVGTYNGTSKAIVLYKAGAQVGTGTLTGTANSSASSPLNFGYSGTAISGVNSIVDQAGFWKGRVLTAGDVTALNNSNNGLSWAAML